MLRGVATRLLLALGLAAILGLGAAVPAAGRGVTLVASPNPAPAYGAVALRGCGYAPSEGATIVMESPTAIGFFGAAVDSDGCLEVWTPTNSPGEYQARSYQWFHGHSRLLARTEFLVEVVP